MPRDLIRIYGFRDYHYITCSCYQRKSLMAWTAARDIFLEVLNQVRARYSFDVMGYVVMPEHFHFMITEPVASSKILRTGSGAVIVHMPSRNRVP